MVEQKTTSLSLAQAAEILGLEEKEDQTYLLPGVLIRVLGDGLAVTHLAPQLHQTTIHTTAPFEFFLSGRHFLFWSQSGQLAIAEVIKNINEP